VGSRARFMLFPSRRLFLTLQWMDMSLLVLLASRRFVDVFYVFRSLGSLFFFVVLFVDLGFLFLVVLLFPGHAFLLLTVEIVSSFFSLG